MFSVFRTISSRLILPISYQSPLSNAVSCVPVLLRSYLPLMTSICGIKVKTILQKRCKDCFYVKRQNRWYVMCKAHPRHKLMQKKRKEKHDWILTNATQSKVRRW